MMRLERDATDAVQALAAARSPDAGATERAWALMQQRLVDGPPPIDIGASSTIASARARWIATGIAVAAALVLAVGVASWSAGWVAGIDARTPGEAPYSTTPSEPSEEVAPEPTPAAARPSAAIVPEPPSADPEPTASGDAPASAAPVVRGGKPGKAARRSASAPAPVPSEPKATTLEAEMRLLARANKSMRAGDPAAALAVLDEHARDFANGQLAPEREYKRALALCELGRTDRARAVADAFVAAHPRSPLRSKAASVCRDEDPR